MADLTKGIKIMRKMFHILIFVSVCCVFLSRTVEAQSSDAYSTIAHFPGENIIYGVAENRLDYSSQLYYCITVTVFLYENGAYVGSRQYAECDASLVHVDVSAPYDSNAEYDTEAIHEVRPFFRYPSGASLDYYNLQSYQEEIDQVEGIFVPIFGFFSGPGPERPSDPGIPLGNTFAIWTLGQQHGQPHHLKLLDDEINQLPNSGQPCGQVERRIKWQVVDEDGKGAGKVALGELFPGTITSSCTGATVPNTSCYIVQGGKVKPQYTDDRGRAKDPDVIRVGCPASTSDCGYTINPNLWVQCLPPKFVTEMRTLASIIYDVRKSSVTIGGKNTVWEKKTEFYQMVVRSPLEHNSQRMAL